jgi:hypothetical protein
MGRHRARPFWKCQRAIRPNLRLRSNVCSVMGRGRAFCNRGSPCGGLLPESPNCRKHQFPPGMIFFFPTTRCAPRLPHDNRQGSFPAVIPVAYAMQARIVPDCESYFRAAASYGSRTSVANKTAIGVISIYCWLLADSVRRFSILEIR